MKNIFIYISIIFLGLTACERSLLDNGDLPTDPNDGNVEVVMNFGADFGNRNIATTKTNVISIATTREYDIKNAVLFVFENHNPVKNAEGEIISADPKGKMLQYAAGYDVPEIELQYKADLVEIKGVPVSVIGVANIPEATLKKLIDAYNIGNTPEGYNTEEYVTFEDFIDLSTVELTTEMINGKKTIAASEKFLKNSDDGLLPISIDPVMLDELTQEKIDEKVATGEFDTEYAFTRIDIVVEPKSTEQGAEIQLVEACLVNVPLKPLYFGDPTTVEYADRTQLVNRSTNLTTTDQPNAQLASNYHLIQGIYAYPMIIVPGETTHKASAVVKAKTSVSEGDGEYYKILIQYNPNSTMTGDAGEEELSLRRDTRYRVVIQEFSGNGYKTLEEAIDGQPSNVKYQITVDPERGNEFVVTNGTIYMALSNTHTDLYGTGVNLQDREIEAFTVSYDKNSDAGNINDPKTYMHIKEEAGGEDIGLDIVGVDTLLTNPYLAEDIIHKIKVKITNTAKFAAAGNTANIIVRIGDLVQEVTFKHYPFGNEDTVIDTYVQEETKGNYEYAYFVPSEPNDYKAWILFGGNNVMEYDDVAGGGIPISFTSLQQGQRDNFECPIYIYNRNGTSSRILVYQESFELVDFSDSEFVFDFLNIDVNDVPSNELVLSNCYILNPSSTQTRKFIIPVENRIEEFLSEDKYLTPTGTPYVINETFDHPYDSLPSNWDVKVTWYDSQRIHDGGIVFEKIDTTYNGQMCISTTLPANFQKFGTMLVTVYVPDAPGSTTGTNLWHWTIWVTDYNPYVILRSNAVKNNIKGTGIYYAASATDLEGNFQDYSTTQPSNWNDFAGPNTLPSALHRYNGGNWDDGSSTDYGTNVGRLIMDRNNGAFDATYAGHGGAMNASTGASSSNPVAGWLSYQFANIVPYPGAGAVDASGSQINIGFMKKYSSFRNVIQQPTVFYIGSGRNSLNGVQTYSTWLGNINITGTGTSGTLATKTYVMYDATMPMDQSDSYEKKSIFDQSPLGFMTPSYNTFGGISTATVNYDIQWPLNTAAVYRKFAYYYFVGYRTSSNGSFRLGKDTYGGVYPRTTRNNMWWSTWSAVITGQYNSSTFQYSPIMNPYADAGAGGAIQLRPVTEFRYDN